MGRPTMILDLSQTVLRSTIMRHQEVDWQLLK